MRRAVIALAVSAALMGGAALAAAEPEAPVAAPSTTEALPDECQVAGAALAATTATPVTTAVATPTVPVLVSPAGDDDAAAPDNDAEARGQGHAMRACIEALHEAGEHGFGEIIANLAHERAEARRDERREDRRDDRRDDGREDSPTVVPSASPTVASGSATTTTANSLTASQPAATDAKSDKRGNSEKHGPGH